MNEELLGIPRRVTLTPAARRALREIGVPRATYGLHARWEPLIIVGGRKRRPGVRDWLSAMPARGNGTLPGRKPIAFCAFLFEALGMVPGDELVDLFPGTGIVSRAWAEVSLTAVASDVQATGCASTKDGRARTTPAPRRPERPLEVA